MLDKLGHSSAPPKSLIDIIRRVRQRWRLKLALRGAVSVMATVVLLTLVAAYGLEWARFSGGSIVAARILIVLAILGSVAYFLVRPLMRRVTDDQVALYLEEHEPSLQATLVSAVEASRGSRTVTSTALVQRLVEQAIERCASADAARKVERVRLRRYAATLGAVVLASAAIFMLGPGFLRHALSAMLLVSRSLEAAAPYRIDVTPGNATVPRGADQTITARLQGFASEDASLMVRRSPTTAFEPLPLVRSESGQYEGMLFDLPAPVDYFVEAGGVRSAVFTLKVLDLPYVQRLELEYHFPAYTGLEPQKIEDGGDIAVLRGTEVRLRVVPTMKAMGGRVVLNDKESVPLASADALTGSFKVDKNGFYRIELDAPTGEKVTASPQYTIDALTDQPPTVSFSKPGRDTTASPIEEVFVEANAEDDYGVRDLELVYSVNGGAEKTLKLFAGRNRLSEVTAGHTFYLEELNVQAGDSVSYYARAADNDAVEGAKRATSDLYFVRVRPFKKDFRAAASMAGGGGAGGGGAGGGVDALSEQQRQIIAATFNVQRDRRTFSREKLKENSTVVALSQARLREQVEGLVTRMNSRLVEPDPSFKKIAELLPQAVTEMKLAEAKLGASSPDGALPPEHKALGLLQKAEEEYETQVSMSQNGGGGGGGGSTMAQELADLFELELDRMANQYETADRAMQQNSDQQLDELLEKLKELARRQEQEAERQRRRALAGQMSSGGGGGAQQRALAEQAEEAARRLERLSRDENRPELMDSARRLREAADAMRKAAASGDAGASAQAAAALERLKETEKRLQRTRTARSERDVKDALRQAEELAREQQSIAEGVRGLNPSADARREQARQLAERKDSLESKLGELEQQLDRSAAEAASDEREASRKMSDAARGIRDNRLRDKIRYSKAMITRGAQPDAAQAMESDITSGFEALKRKLGEAQSALGQSKPDSKGDALDKARRLARGMESLEQRMKERARSGDRSQGSEGSDKQNSKGSEGSQSSQGSKGSQQGSQSSQGSQSADGSDGSPDATGSADGRLGNGDARGGYVDGGGWGNRWWGFNPDDIRQWRGEIRQWSNEVQDLRRMLRSENLDPKELDAILKALRELDDERVYKDLAELTRLQTFVTEGLKRFEYGLRRKVDASNGDVLLSGSDEVPEEFRTLVAEYYRSLAKSPSPK